MLAFTMNTRDNVTEILLEILCKYGCFTYLFKLLSERQDVNLPTEDKFCNLKHSTIDYTFSYVFQLKIIAMAIATCNWHWGIRGN